MTGPLEVWQINCPLLSPAILERCGAVLSQTELAQEARFRQKADRLRFRVGRGLVRLLSAQRTGVPPMALTWEQADQGKPSWGNVALPFNLSHSGDWVVLALGGTSPLGVDIQFHAPGLDIEAIAGYAMSPEERACLSALSDGAYRETFFDLWVLREAGVKATGLGVFDQSRNVSALPIPARDTWAAADGLKTPGLWVRMLPKPQDYAAALAVISGRPPRDAPRLRDMDDLPPVIGLG